MVFPFAGFTIPKLDRKSVIARRSASVSAARRRICDCFPAAAGRVCEIRWAATAWFTFDCAEYPGKFYGAGCEPSGGLASYDLRWGGLPGPAQEQMARECAARPRACLRGRAPLERWF